MAQFGQSARLGAVRSQVRILLPRFYFLCHGMSMMYKKTILKEVCYMLHEVKFQSFNII